MLEINTANILFIAGGAFVGLDQVVRNRIQGTSIGFQAAVEISQDASLDQAVPDDLVRYGMIPEFVGRFPNWVALQELSESDMINILTGVKNSYVDQYKWLFEQDGVELNFTSEALTTVAQRTLKTHTGARGLHSELERVLLPHMFRLKRYARSGIKCVEIDQDLVNNPQALKEAA
jgi:ATP-dependent Clp protease ATP-binding subunit ClpX